MTKTKRKPMQLSDEERARRSDRMKAQMAAKRAVIVERTASETTERAIAGQQVQESSIATAAKDMGTVTRRDDNLINAGISVAERVMKTLASDVDANPERRARLTAIQARTMAQLAQTKEGREALERLEQRHYPTVPEIAKAFDPASKTIMSSEEMNKAFIPEPPKPVVREVPFKTPFRLTGSQSGLMVSELGPCWCGAAKLKWHEICLKVKV